MEGKKLAKQINELFENVSFIKDFCATKEDLKEFATKEDLKEFATKEDLVNFKDEILSHLDRFVDLYQGHDMEIAALIARTDRIEEKCLLCPKQINK